MGDNPDFQIPGLKDKFGQSAEGNVFQGIFDEYAASLKDPLAGFNLKGTAGPGR